MLHAAGTERRMNVVNDHGPDGFAAMGLPQQIVRQGGCRDFRNMFVLANGGDFIFVQSAKGDAIVQRDHGILQRPFVGPAVMWISQSPSSAMRNDADQWVSSVATIAPAGRGLVVLGGLSAINVRFRG